MTAAGASARSVVKKNSSRWVPWRSRTNTQRNSTSPRPDLYQWPVPPAVWTWRADRVPADRLPPEPAPPGDDLPGLGQLAALDPRAAVAAVARRRLEQVGVGVQLADQRQPRNPGPTNSRYHAGALRPPRRRGY